MKFVRWLIHIPALTLSLVMVIDTLGGISIDPFWHWFFIGCAIYAELFGQFVRALAAAYHKHEKYLKAGLCWLLVGIYIGAFAGVSAVGVFMTKVSNEEQRAKININNQTDASDDYARTKIELNNKIAQQNAEYFKNKGKGRNYEQLGTDIVKLKTDLGKYEKQLNRANRTIIHTERSIFSYMPAGARIPMFCAIMFIIYTGLLLTPWPIDPIELKVLNNEDTTKNQKPQFTTPDLVVPLSKVLPKVSEVDQTLPTASDKISDIIPSNSENTPSLTSEQLKQLDFVNALWGDSKEELPTHLTPLEKTGFPERTANKYSDYFRDIGAIEKVQGRPCKPKWPLSRIIRYIENEEVS